MGGGGQGAGKRQAGALSAHKTKKITRTVPILKSNSTQFAFFFYDRYYNFPFIKMRKSQEQYQY